MRGFWAWRGLARNLHFLFFFFWGEQFPTTAGSRDIAGCSGTPEPARVVIFEAMAMGALPYPSREGFSFAPFLPVPQSFQLVEKKKTKRSLAPYNVETCYPSGMDDTLFSLHRHRDTPRVPALQPKRAIQFADEWGSERTEGGRPAGWRPPYSLGERQNYRGTASSPSPVDQGWPGTGPLNLLRLQQPTLGGNADAFGRQEQGKRPWANAGIHKNSCFAPGRAACFLSLGAPGTDLRLFIAASSATPETYEVRKKGSCWSPSAPAAGRVAARGLGAEGASSPGGNCPTTS